VNSFLKTPIEFLKGVGPQRAELLQQELGVFTFNDLLNYFPFRYVDRTKLNKVSELTPDMNYVQLKGKLSNLQAVGQPGKQRLTAKFADDSGAIDLIWFRGVKWLQTALKPNTTYILFGKPSVFNRKMNIAHPDLESPESQMGLPQLQPVYPNTEKLRNRKIDNKIYRKWFVHLFENPGLRIDEYLPTSVTHRQSLISRELAYKWVHNPSGDTEINAALDRLKFDEFFILQLSILRLKQSRTIVKGLIFSKVGDYFNRFYNEQLSFELTNAQKRVIKEIRSDVGRGQQMNRLLQGDVGSGKSIVAILSLLIAIDNGYQAALMAPTEILANQHYEGFKDKLESIGLRAALLTGSTKSAERKKIHEGLTSGDIHLLIGTHALIEDTVAFKNLGMVVIDEQHRFGVAQRAKLWKKSTSPPHVLVMTATPIPRTLAMTVYGDLDVSKIDELPGGRKPIMTAHRSEANRLRVRGFVKEQVDAGRQVYIVFPLIEESETLDYKNLQEGFDLLVEHFERPKYQIDMLHGRMKPEEKDAVMNRFKDGVSHILVSTTVIEVGINVPNATVMIIESAEKFGLAQLHQLRGRVGRGSEQSYCILMTGNKVTKVARQRLSAMVETTDGFEIAEFDLKLRGPGDIEGTRQSGLLDLKLASITKDEALLERARAEAMNLLAVDPTFTNPEHLKLKNHLNQIKGFVDWSRVS
jgi:ATP-dependent DNA helicase RecG